MPAKSKKQYRFMQAVAHGWKPDDSGPSKSQAKEYISGQGKKAYKKLPEKKKKLKKEDSPFKPSKQHIKEDRALPKKPNPKPAAPVKPKMKLTPEKLKEIASQQGVKTRFIKEEGDWTLERLEKAFERRDDYTLVDPREYYGALQVVSKKVMGWVSEASKGLGEGEARDYILPVEGATLKIRKITNDMYSGHIIDKGGDIKHLYDRLTLPALATQIMSVYEVYDEKVAPPQEEPQTLRGVKTEIESINSELKGKKSSSKDVKRRLHALIDNLARIDQMALDAQTRQAQMHDKLVDRTERELNNIHTKLKGLRDVVEAQHAPEAPAIPDQMVVRQVGEPGKCHDCGQFPCKCYIHLPKPCIEVEPSGKITIMFKSEWNDLDKVNFLQSMKYVVDKKRK